LEGFIPHMKDWAWEDPPPRVEGNGLDDPATEFELSIPVESRPAP
jgi:hypothetical protein